jgi:hypothetical protein
MQLEPAQGFDVTGGVFATVTDVEHRVADASNNKGFSRKICRSDSTNTQKSRRPH